MSDDDFQFGELETARPEVALRPDRNKHYAVVALGDPQEKELPIFVDLDVMRDMEQHAISDTTVELGGVLLGAACHDADGKPFVIVTDSLRAKHFEATKGSFKFTHETWSEISRERDQFPPELQMVGWYHTHPDWGVFLSGMDMFICNNFFNKPLDIALVIDPCRGDRGMFQWVPHGAKQTTHRTGGFYLVASRFREDDLNQFTQFLAGDGDMPDFNAPRSTGGGQTVVHLHGQPPGWQGAAVMGMLTLQFCLLALLAWKMLGPPEEKSSLEKQVAKLIDERAAAERADTQKKTLDLVLGELKGTEAGYTDKLEKQVAANKELKKAAADQLELAGKREADALALKTKLEAEKKLAAIYKQDFDEEKANRVKAEKSIKEFKTRLEEYEKPADEDKKKSEGVSSMMQWIVLAVVTALFSGAIVAAFLFRKPEESDEEAEAPLPSPPGRRESPDIAAGSHPEIDPPQSRERT